MKKIAILLILLMIDPRLAGARDLYSTSKMRSDCESQGTDESWQCIGYVRGYIDLLYHLITPGNPFNICLPEAGMSVAQISLMIENRVHADPASMSQPARLIIWQEVARTFPCPGK